MELLMTLFKKSPLSILPNLIIIIFFFQQDTLMRKLTCKTLMEILPGEVFSNNKILPPPTHTHTHAHTDFYDRPADLWTAPNIHKSWTVNAPGGWENPEGDGREEAHLRL